ncbi:M20 family metallopeptidase [Agriterribacter sp.]|uniref:M20 metallopeptidase family protein n=1 Tax=Agriterribacter sp. TaxID=2821509 RepID=UPI002CF4CE01|nr:M20 family metallopeptidase [Agriterribacter sp.]HRP55851.1 M20 family metallopeptidase [Agriterribacter sp.]
MLKEEIKQLSKNIHQTVISNRRHLHAHPELSFEEYNTSAFVKARLDEMGITWHAIANTGVVAVIEGTLFPGKAIALRADMDALPITEANQTDYVSQHKGIMHACGHDAHTSSLLGTAYILQTLKNKFGGTVKLIFQPAEEKLPGGASLMIKEGVLKDPAPQFVIGQHVMPSIECGKIGIRKGKLMASMDELLVTVRGRGGHGAQPHQNVDPVLIASHIIVALQQIVSRMANPANPTVLSFGKLAADGAVNVIPDTVYMEGTFRTLNEDWRNEAHVQIKKMAAGIAESMGGSCDFIINRGYPCLINEEDLTGQAGAFAEEYVGKENIIDPGIWTASEDFAFYSQVTDSCFYFLGTANADRHIVSSLHTPTFDIDEEALEISTGLMAYIALRRLGNG